MSFATSQKLIKPSLVVIAGPNGSGKTAITKIVHDNYSWINGLIEVNFPQWTKKIYDALTRRSP